VDVIVRIIRTWHDRYDSTTEVKERQNQLKASLDCIRLTLIPAGILTQKTGAYFL